MVVTIATAAATAKSPGRRRRHREHVSDLRDLQHRRQAETRRQERPRCSIAHQTRLRALQDAAMFFVPALAIWTAMNVYVLWRVRGVPAVARHVPRWAMVVAGVFAASSYILARVLEALKYARIGVVLEWIGAEWMGALVIALGCFFIADIITGFGSLMRARVPAIRTAALAISIALTFAAVVNALRPPVVRDHEVRVENLPPERDGAVVVAISDLHLGTLTTDRWFASVVDEVEALRPDLVLIAGDLTEGDGPPESEMRELLARLRAPLGVWAVPGNHERYQGGSDSLLQEAGIHVLRDQSAEVAPGLFVAGVDTAGHTRVPGRGLVVRAIAGIPREKAAILLSHYPEQVQTAARGGVDLMIAGHTHAGQIWPFNYFVRMAYRYMGGRYDVDGMPLIVCRGTGTWGPRMRLFYPNEILRIVLRRA
jgi:uncharacterized protein